MIYELFFSKINTNPKTPSPFNGSFVKCVRLALSEQSERIYASRVSECEHMQIGFFERSEKMPGSKFAPISNTRSKRACYKIKVQKSLIFDLP